MSLDLPTVAATAAAAVLGVSPAAADRPQRPHRAGRTRGSATALADGTLVTAAHLVGGADRVLLHLPGGATAGAAVVAASEERDLAVLRPDDPDGLADRLGGAGLAPADAADVPLGTPVAAAAAPDGTPRVTAGTVAAVGTRLRTRTGSPVDGLLEHTAPLPRGASGGPVLDADGRLLALDLNRLEGGLYQAVLLTAEVRAALAALGRGEVPATRRLGIAVVPTARARRLRDAVGLPAADGVLVGAVDPDGPAATAGLDRGDLITAVDGTPVAGPDDLLLALRRAGDGPLELAVSRGGAPARAATVPAAA